MLVARRRERGHLVDGLAHLAERGALLRHRRRSRARGSGGGKPRRDADEGGEEGEHERGAWYSPSDCAHTHTQRCAKVCVCISLRASVLRRHAPHAVERAVHHRSRLLAASVAAAARARCEVHELLRAGTGVPRARRGYTIVHGYGNARRRRTLARADVPRARGRAAAFPRRVASFPLVLSFERDPVLRQRAAAQLRRPSVAVDTLASVTGPEPPRAAVRTRCNLQPGVKALGLPRQRDAAQWAVYDAARLRRPPHCRERGGPWRAAVRRRRRRFAPWPRARVRSRLSHPRRTVIVPRVEHCPAARRRRPRRHALTATSAEHDCQSMPATPYFAHAKVCRHAWETRPVGADDLGPAVHVLMRGLVPHLLGSGAGGRPGS